MHKDSTTIYDEPELEDKPLSPQAAKAKSVLETLDEMRASGASTHAQFEFLRRHLPSPHDEPEDTRLPIEVRLERQEAARSEFRRIQDSMTHLLTLWRDASVLPTEVKEIGRRMLEKVDEIRMQAELDSSKQWKSEIEMLAELWRSAPDVSAVFGCQVGQPYDSPKAGKTPEEIKARALSTKLHKENYERAKEAKAIKELEDKIEEVLNDPDFKELEAKADDPNFKKELEARETVLLKFEEGGEGDRPARIAEEFRKEARRLDNRSAAELRKFPLVCPDVEPEERVVGSVSDPVPSDGDELARLRQEIWTDALNDLTTEKWKFVKEMTGRVGPEAVEGSVWIWEFEDREARLELKPPLGRATITVQGPEGFFHENSEVFSPPDFEKLLAQPEEFIKKALKP